MREMRVLNKNDRENHEQSSNNALKRPFRPNREQKMALSFPAVTSHSLLMVTACHHGQTLNFSCCLFTLIVHKHGYHVVQHRKSTFSHSANCSQHQSFTGSKHSRAPIQYVLISDDEHQAMQSCSNTKHNNANRAAL